MPVGPKARSPSAGPPPVARSIGGAARAAGPIDVAVPGTLAIDETRTGLAPLRGGAGLMHAPEAVPAPLAAADAVAPVLEDRWPTGPGSHMSSAGRRQLAVGFRLAIRDTRPLGL